MGSLFDVMEVGILHSLKNSIQSNFDKICWFKGFLEGKKLSIFRNLSITTMITYLLLAWGRLIIQFMDLSVQIVVVIGNGCNAPRVFTVSPLFL